MSWVTMKWRRSCSRQLIPSRRASSANRWDTPSGRMGLEPSGARLKTLMSMVPGPDFPTGGFIYGREGIQHAYETGRGSLVVRARVAIDRAGRSAERMAIVVTEIPFQINKAKLIERIAELINNKKIDGISDLRDESDRDGMRIVIELKRDAIPDIVLNNLYKLTPMQQTFGVINLAIVNGQPRELTLVDALNKARPTAMKGIFLKKLSVSSTMGVGVKVDVASLSAQQ